MDKRVLQTKAAIRAALMACLKETPIEKIQITRICELADINRTTFYKYYKDCTDIVKEVENEQLQDFRMLFESKDIFGAELINAVLDQIEKSKDHNNSAIVKCFSKNYINEMASIAKEYSFDIWKERMPKATDQEVELALTVMISATLQIVVNESGKYDRETIVRFIKNMINGCVARSFK